MTPTAYEKPLADAQRKARDYREALTLIAEALSDEPARVQDASCIAEKALTGTCPHCDSTKRDPLELREVNTRLLNPTLDSDYT